MQYFMDEGPKGPKREVIAQEFCYKMLSEGSDFFNKNIANELYYQKQYAEQIQQKLKSEIQEIKEEKRKATENLETKLRATEIEKAELSAREQSVRENLLHLSKEKERQEQVLQDKLAD
jgi:cell division ATPase FtsA